MCDLFLFDVFLRRSHTNTNNAICLVYPVYDADSLLTQVCCTHCIYKTGNDGGIDSEAGSPFVWLCMFVLVCLSDFFLSRVCVSCFDLNELGYDGVFDCLAVVEPLLVLSLGVCLCLSVSVCDRVCVLCVCVTCFSLTKEVRNRSDANLRRSVLIAPRIPHVG